MIIYSIKLYQENINLIINIFKIISNYFINLENILYSILLIISYSIYEVIYNMANFMIVSIFIVPTRFNLYNYQQAYEKGEVICPPPRTRNF
jgi:TM2 domain-containing membrane protein YozV